MAWCVSQDLNCEPLPGNLGSEPGSASNAQTGLVAPATRNPSHACIGGDQKQNDAEGLGNFTCRKAQTTRGTSRSLDR